MALSECCRGDRLSVTSHSLPSVVLPHTLRSRLEKPQLASSKNSAAMRARAGSRRSCPHTRRRCNMSFSDSCGLTRCVILPSAGDIRRIAASSIAGQQSARSASTANSWFLLMASGTLQ